MAVSGDVVRAAGGVISRRDERGEIEVLLVYRAGGQRDWSFPKGKVEPGETDEACALREVWEETNLRCALGGSCRPSPITTAEAAPRSSATGP